MSAPMEFASSLKAIKGTRANAKPKFPKSLTFSIFQSPASFEKAFFYDNYLHISRLYFTFMLSLCYLTQFAPYGCIEGIILGTEQQKARFWRERHKGQGRRDRFLRDRA